MMVLIPLSSYFSFRNIGSSILSADSLQEKKALPRNYLGGEEGETWTKDYIGRYSKYILYPL